MAVERDVKPQIMTFAKVEREREFNMEGAFIQINDTSTVILYAYPQLRWLASSQQRTAKKTIFLIEANRILDSIPKLA